LVSLILSTSGRFSLLIKFLEGEKLYYIGKNKKEKRLVIYDDEGKKRIFRDCHDSAAGGHWGQKKTLEKIESLFFWRGMVKDIVGWVLYL
jgi:Integrase zinc binding domain